MDSMKPRRFIFFPSF